MYSKCGRMEDAQLVFDSLAEKDRDVVAWTALISGYAQTCDRDNADRVFELFMNMERRGIEPISEGLLLTLVGVAVDKRLRRWGEWMEAWLRERGRLSLMLENALLEMHAKAANFTKVQQIFDSMEGRRDTISWNILLNTYGREGKGKLMLSLLEQMEREGCEWSDATWLVVLSGCSHAFLVDEGLGIFKRMMLSHASSSKKDHMPGLIKETHYNCVVDLLARAGRLDEAEKLANEMPPPGPGQATLQTLLAACRSRKDVERAERIFYRLERMVGDEASPLMASPMVLLGNTYAAVGRHEDALKVREKMKRLKIRKIPGQSWIEINGAAHTFTANDWSHPEAKAIHLKMDEIFDRITSGWGHLPDTSWVLQDLKSEEEKIKSLSAHSEKLAVAYGLMKTKEGEPLVIFKNLRMCGDCHNAIKLISSSYKRDILISDARRYHFFSDGHCSCAGKY